MGVGRVRHTCKGPAVSACEQPQVPLQRDPGQTGFPALHIPMGHQLVTFPFLQREGEAQAPHHPIRAVRATGGTTGVEGEQKRGLCWVRGGRAGGYGCAGREGCWEDASRMCFCNVTLSPADHRPVGHSPCLVSPPSTGGALCPSDEWSQGHCACWQCGGVAEHQDLTELQEGTRHLPREVIWCRDDSACNCILQLQKNSQYLAFLNLRKANFHLCMHETSSKGIFTCRQKLIFCLSQRTREEILTAGNNLCSFALPLFLQLRTWQCPHRLPSAWELKKANSCLRISLTSRQQSESVCLWT